jgi:hypothetical protein
VSLELDDALSELERRMFASHLSRCAECQAYAAEVRAFTQALRATPLEPLERPIVVAGRRRRVAAHLQMGAAAAMAIVTLGLASQIAASQPADQPPLGSVGELTRYPTQAQLDQELAMLEGLAAHSSTSTRGFVL